MRLSNKNLHLKTSVSLLTLAAFLLLGFCPLRNALIRDLGGSPEKAGKPLPEYRKINSASHCPVVCRLKTIPPTEQVDHLPSKWLTGGLPGSSFIAGTRQADAPLLSPIQLRRREAPVPLYIRNRVLRL